MESDKRDSDGSILNHTYTQKKKKKQQKEKIKKENENKRQTHSLLIKN